MNLKQARELKAAIQQEQAIDAINKMLLKTWLIARCDVEQNITFRFLVDGFAMIKCQITKGGNLRVFRNRCKDEPSYPEDAAFQFNSFALGKIVTLEKFAKYARAWVAISNLRMQLVTQGYEKFIFNPHANKIMWHNDHGWWYFALEENAPLCLDADKVHYLDTHCGYHSIARPASKNRPAKFSCTLES